MDDEFEKTNAEMNEKEQLEANFEGVGKKNTRKKKAN